MLLAWLVESLQAGLEDETLFGPIAMPVTVAYAQHIESNSLKRWIAYYTPKLYSCALVTGVTEKVEKDVIGVNRQIQKCCQTTQI